jgi:transcriptional regulator of acetoin/glycerol metabolism
VGALLSQGLSLATIEQQAVVKALERTEGDVSEAARLLGVTTGFIRLVVAVQ